MDAFLQAVVHHIPSLVLLPASVLVRLGHSGAHSGKSGQILIILFINY
jgi:hypothetical protein